MISPKCLKKNAKHPSYLLFVYFSYPIKEFINDNNNHPITIATRFENNQTLKLFRTAIIFDNIGFTNF